MSQEIVNSAKIIAETLKANVTQVEAAIRLLDEGATVPFIARYRKEATGGLNDTQLRQLVERLHYIRELEARRTVILQSIREQNKLTTELEKAILTAATKARLEDLYLAYRPKRRTKAQLAKEAGLEPLALALWQNPNLDMHVQAQAFINEEANIVSPNDALVGAQQILMERFAEDAELIGELREYLWQHAFLNAKVIEAKRITGQKFADYFDYIEPLKTIPSHRALALFRGRRESILRLHLKLENDFTWCQERIAIYFKICDAKRASDAWLLSIVRLVWDTKLLPKLELELLNRLREAADEVAISVFNRNLRDLLLAAPAGPHIILGLDPGIRTGVKAAVVDKTGKLLDYLTVFPLSPHNEWHQSITELARLIIKNQVSLISIGNGTGSRETERLVAEMMKRYPDLQVSKIVVSEAGASVYSASPYAAKEFPELDVTLRGAVSIARRLQDPLAELIKIDPKSIGVGQYQHDVNQTRLERSLVGIVQDCVNAVGVDVNTASPALLTYVSGLNLSLAENLVDYRNEHGLFKTREELKLTPRMGEKTFQQAAGFLRIHKGDNPLDASAVHPEAYFIVEKIAADQNIDFPAMIGNSALLRTIDAARYVDETKGLMTIRDILRELEKPGRDPRPKFKTVNFQEGIESINHLEKGMILEGVVSNVTNFGAFVDVGVHQDGLVHISAMGDGFISSPYTVVKAGDIVTVKVIELDKERRRIGLSMKLTAAKPLAVCKNPTKTKFEKTQVASIKKDNQPKKQKSKGGSKVIVKKTIFNTAMADALAKLKRDS